MGQPQFLKPEVISTQSGTFIILSRDEAVAAELIRVGIWESPVLAVLNVLLSLYPGDVVDVGANMGAIAVPMAKMRPNSKFYAFEPQRIVYQQLCGNAVLNAVQNLYPYNLAVGGPDDDGRMLDIPLHDFNLDPTSGTMSFDARVNEAQGRHYDAYEKVAMVSLDSLGLTNIAVVKIDVEGYELKVMQGMMKMLEANNFPAVVFEVWREGTFTWVMEDRAAIVALLEGAGYDVTIMENFTMGVAQHKSRENTINLRTVYETL